jgi:hypothetical protein
MPVFPTFLVCSTECACTAIGYGCQAYKRWCQCAFNLRSSCCCCGPALLLRPCPAAAALPCCCGHALLPANCPSSLCQRLQSSEPLPALFFVLDRSPTWSFENQKDVRKRPPGPVQNPQKDAVSDPQGFLGISKAFGFTKRNEASRQC